eukprot:1068492-Pyramimonas_sp.AAC.1
MLCTVKRVPRPRSGSQFDIARCSHLRALSYQRTCDFAPLSLRLKGYHLLFRCAAPQGVRIGYCVRTTGSHQACIKPDRLA